MTQPGRDDYDRLARAQVLLLNRHQLSSATLIAAYRTVRAATPNAYTEMFIEALISEGYASNGEARMAAWTEAVEIARGAADSGPREMRLLVRALRTYQDGLSEMGRRAEALEVCREMALAGERAYQAGAVPSPTFGAWPLACRLAEEGRHGEAAALLEAIVRDKEREGAGRDFWSRIAWIAELEATGDHPSARGALHGLIDQDRRHAEQHTGSFSLLIWELLLSASMERENGFQEEAEKCDQETEQHLASLAADGEPKMWGDNHSSWAVLAGLTGRKQDRPACGEPEAPLFADLGWSPDVRRTYLEAGRESLVSEMARIAELAEDEPSAHLGQLVEMQRRFTLRSVKYWTRRTKRVTDELRECFDEGVHLARGLVEVDEVSGRAALSRALADRTSMHIAARDFPPALSDFQRSRRVAAGGLVG